MTDYFEHVAAFVELVEELKAQVHGPGGRFVAGGGKVPGAPKPVEPHLTGGGRVRGGAGRFVSKKPVAGGTAVVEKPKTALEELVSKPIKNGQEIPNNLIESGERTAVGVGSYNAPMKVTLGDKAYFIKTTDNPQGFGGLSREQVLNNELRAPALGQAMGLEMNPVGILQHPHLGTLVVQDWVEGALPAHAIDARPIVKALSSDTGTKLLMLEYLSGDRDRHSSNLMVVGGQVREIDFGFSQQKTVGVSFGRSYLADHMNERGAPISPMAIRSVLSKREAILKAVEPFSSPSAVKIMTKRLDRLEKAYALMVERQNRGEMRGLVTPFAFQQCLLDAMD